MKNYRKIILLFFLTGFTLAADNLDIAKREFKVALELIDNDEKLAIYDRILRYAPYFMPALYNRALLLMKKKSWDEAKVDLSIYLDRNPEDFNALNNLAYIEFIKENKENALKLWQRALKIDPNNYKVIKNMAMLLYSLNRGKDALFFIDKALKITPNDLSLLKTKALIFSTEKDVKKELVFLEDYIAKNPNDDESLYRYVFLRSANEKNNDLFSFIKKIAKNNKIKANYFIILSQLSSSKEEKHFALSYLERLLKERKELLDDSVFVQAINLLMSCTDSEKSNEIIELMSQEYENHPSFILLRAYKAYSDKQYRQARELSMEVLMVEADNEKALDIYFNTFVLMGEEDEFLNVMKDRRERLNIITHNAAVMELKLLLKRNDYESASRLCKSYLDSFPQNAEFQLTFGSIFFNNEMIDEAVIYLEQAYALDHSLYNAGIMYAKALYKKGFIKDALAVMSEVYENFSFKKEVVMSYIHLLYNAENFDLSRSLYEKVKKQQGLPDYDYYFSDFHRKDF